MCGHVLVGNICPSVLFFILSLKFIIGIFSVVDLGVLGYQQGCSGPKKLMVMSICETECFNVRAGEDREALCRHNDLMYLQTSVLDKDLIWIYLEERLSTL